MQTLSRVTLLLTLIGTAAVLSAAEKQAKFEPAARAKVIGPFIDEQAFAIAHVNVSRIEAGPLVALAAQLRPAAQDAANLQGAKTKFAAWLAPFSKAGAKDVYFVVGLADLSFQGGNPPLVFAIVPLSTGADVKALSEAFGKMAETTERLDGVLYAGSRTMLQRLKNKQWTPDDRPALAAAFAAAGDTAAQVLFVPPRHWQRVIEEMMPKMPPAIGGGPSSIFTHGMRWAALGIDPPPQFP